MGWFHWAGWYRLVNGGFCTLAVANGQAIANELYYFCRQEDGGFTLLNTAISKFVSCYPERGSGENSTEIFHSLTATKNLPLLCWRQNTSRFQNKISRSWRLKMGRRGPEIKHSVIDCDVVLSKTITRTIEVQVSPRSSTLPLLAKFLENFLLTSQQSTKNL